MSTLNSSRLKPIPRSRALKIGDVVLISDPSEGIGVVRYIDEINYVVGIELTDPLGNSDGSLHGKTHFKCRPKYGIFVSVRDIQRLVSPEELLHKIVVLNRALAHKHSTLNTQTQTIDKLKHEVAAMQDTLTTYMQREQHLKQQIRDLKHQSSFTINNHHHHHDDDDDDNHHNGYSMASAVMPSSLLQQIQNRKHNNTNNGHYLYAKTSLSAHRPSKPHTPEREKAVDIATYSHTDTSSAASAGDEMMPAASMAIARATVDDTHSLLSASSSRVDSFHDDDDDEDENHVHDHAAASSSSSSSFGHHKPRSQPPSRRASFLSNVDANHPYGDNIVSRELILNRGKKISSALTDYMHRDRPQAQLPQPPHQRGKHSRHLSNEQLGLLQVSAPPQQNMTPANSANVKPKMHPPHHHSQYSQYTDDSPRSSTNSSASKRRKSKTHRKQLSNVDLAAQILNQQVQQANKALKQKYHAQYRPFNDGRDGEEEDDGGLPMDAPAVLTTSASMVTHDIDDKDNMSDDVLDDASFRAMSNRFNDSIGNHTNVPAMPPPRARKSHSQPVSPKHYLDAFHFRSNRQQQQQPPLVSAESHPITNAQMPPLRAPRLHMASFSTRSHLSDGFEFPHRAAGAGGGSAAATTSTSQQSPLKASSMWRRNRDAFLKQMDKKLEAAMTKFAAKNETADAGAGVTTTMLPRPISARFSGAPLTRKRGHSYHHGSTEMQRMRMMASANGDAHHTHHTRTTTFSAYTHQHKVSADNEQMLALLKTQTQTQKQTAATATNEVDVLFERQPSFRMQPRRSISLPSSPKHSSHSGVGVAVGGVEVLKSQESRSDALDLGDDDMSMTETPRQDAPRHVHMQQDEEERPMEAISDESSIADEEEEEEDAVDEDMSETTLARKESEPISLDRSIRRRRLRMGMAVKGKSKNLYHDSQQRSTIQMYDAATMKDAMMVQSDDDEEEEEDEEHKEQEEETRAPYGQQRNRRIMRRRTYFKEEDTDSEQEISNTDHDDEEEEEEEEEEAQSDLDVDAYKYYQTKKRNSQVNVFAKEELEQEYKSIFQ